ncbi:hypothetical protein [Bartonella raoultii]|uniref:hypothetical protein n=1 Tax=Bartonella raoultii TaxID=1457020 RepID=UPI001ABB8904|nr:hypothetical protein [Bartonella raoultii]
MKKTPNPSSSVSKLTAHFENLASSNQRTSSPAPHEQVNEPSRQRRQAAVEAAYVAHDLQVTVQTSQQPTGLHQGIGAGAQKGDLPPRPNKKLSMHRKSQ